MGSSEGRRSTTAKVVQEKRDDKRAANGQDMPLAATVKSQMLRLLRRTKSTRERVPPRRQGSAPKTTKRYSVLDDIPEPSALPDITSKPPTKWTGDSLEKVVTMEPPPPPSSKEKVRERAATFSAPHPPKDGHQHRVRHWTPDRKVRK